MKSVILFRMIFLLVAAGLGAAVVHAEDLNAVKARMERRQPAVDALRDRQLAGENNRGYLEARGSVSGTDQQTISEENADRRVVYQGLAAQTKTDAETIGRKRAQTIASLSKRGVWVQSPRGEWAQKS